MLKVQYGKSYIHKMKDTNNLLVSATLEIAKCFLSNVNNATKSNIMEEGQDQLESYLKISKANKITPQAAQKLDIPFIGKLNAIIKDLSLGKSPGPDCFTVQYYKHFERSMIDQLPSQYNHRKHI
ncbi:hypothetical protein XENTR_v10011143 [Xenopus tropicalis]|nr:hypothetical protein XENTR_v10011143 [Xenopus tropicalis]